MPISFTTVLAVMFGGACGAVVRFGTDVFLTALLRRPVFPWGILLINICGGLLMGLLQGRIQRSGRPHALLYSLLGTGFLGGFTTVSTFALQTFDLWKAGRSEAALLYVGASVVLAVGAAALGFRAGAGGPNHPRSVPDNVQKV